MCTGNENSKPIWNKFIIRKDIIETSQVVLNFCRTVYICLHLILKFDEMMMSVMYNPMLPVFSGSSFLALSLLFSLTLIIVFSGPTRIDPTIYRTRVVRYMENTVDSTVNDEIWISKKNHTHYFGVRCTSRLRKTMDAFKLDYYHVTCWYMWSFQEV